MNLLVPVGEIVHVFSAAMKLPDIEIGLGLVAPFPNKKWFWALRKGVLVAFLS